MPVVYIEPNASSMDMTQAILTALQNADRLGDYFVVVARIGRLSLNPYTRGMRDHIVAECKEFVRFTGAYLS